MRINEGLICSYIDSANFVVLRTIIEYFFRIMLSSTLAQKASSQLSISIFDIPKMDCPCEEQLIRMKLAPYSSIRELRFYLSDRRLEVIHSAEVSSIAEALDTLNLGSRCIGTSLYIGSMASLGEGEKLRQREQRLLWWVLSINFLCFLLELTYGIISHSMGLVADGLDMLADAVVYGLSLWAVGASLKRKQHIALVAGILQILLASWGVVEVLERFWTNAEIIDFCTMIYVSFIALFANTLSLLILNKSDNREAHFEASRIFTSGDIIVNIGVIVSAVLVSITDTHYPDLLVGALVFLLVLRGGVRIIRLAQA